MLCGYGSHNSEEPPIGIVGLGRGNHEGASYLYLAESEYTACCELKPIPTRCISLAHFKTLKTLNLFDLSKPFADESIQNYRNSEMRNYNLIDIVGLVEKMRAEFTQPAEDSREDNRVTQYLSDQIRKTGIDGILFMSFFMGRNNLLLFNRGEYNIRFGESRIVQAGPPYQSIFDLNNNQVMPTEEFIKADQYPSFIENKKEFLRGKLPTITV